MVFPRHSPTGPGICWSETETGTIVAAQRAAPIPAQSEAGNVAVKKKAGRSFNPAILVAAEPDSATEALDKLAALTDAKVPVFDLEGWTKRVSGKVNVGLLFVLADGLEPFGELFSGILEKVHALDPGLPVVLTGRGLDARRVAMAFRSGATDVFPLEEAGAGLPGELSGMLERRASRSSGTLFPEAPGVPRMLGCSKPMQEVARLVERVAPSDATVLILGESGTGKELIARAMHAFSPRKKGPFVAINCAAIPETLLENELFGHEKGAYTGASQTSIGKVEAAEKGTLFLDEIGEMPIPLQAKILRLLQDKSYDRIGGTRTRQADIRIVTATNRELKDEVAAGRFREDLYYRLSVVPVELPGLRERAEDVPVLANFVMSRLADKLGRPGLRLAPEAMERLVSYRWPGNVRELENELERAAVLALADEVQAKDLELRARVDDPDTSALARLGRLDAPLEEMLEQVSETARRIRVSIALERADGNAEIAALQLGITLEELEKLRASS